MIHAMKTSLGTYRATDNDGTHVVLSNAEIHDIIGVSRMLRDDIQRFSRESVELHRKVQEDFKTIESLKSELAVAEGTIEELSEQKNDLEQSISTLKEEITKLTDDLAHVESLNKNLRRICRERANQARGLQKNSDGYVVLISQEWREKAQNGQLIRGYKTTIQSPLDAGMDDETAKRQIFDDLIEGVLADLGCPYYEQVNGRPAEPIEELSMYRWVFTADYRVGLWTVSIYTSGPLKVPPHRRPPRKQRTQGENQNDQHKSGRSAEKSAEKGG